MERKIYRGDIFYANLNGAIGSEQNGIRPVVIVQNDMGNEYSPTTIIIPLTKKINTKAKLPTHLNLKASRFITFDSVVLSEQIRVIDKTRLIKKIGNLNENVMQLIDKKIKIALQI